MGTCEKSQVPITFLSYGSAVLSVRKAEQAKYCLLRLELCARNRDTV